MPSIVKETSATNASAVSGLRSKYQASAAHFFSGNHFDSTAVNIVNPALDLFRPGFLHSGVGWSFIEALNQAIDNETTLVGREAEGFLQEIGRLRCQVRHACPHRSF
jgi:hypothetical protein